MGQVDFSMTAYSFGIDYAAGESTCQVIVSTWGRPGPVPFTRPDGSVVNYYGPEQWIPSASRTGERRGGVGG